MKVEETRDYRGGFLESLFTVINYSFEKSFFCTHSSSQNVGNGRNTNERKERQCCTPRHDINSILIGQKQGQNPRPRWLMCKID